MVLLIKIGGSTLGSHDTTYQDLVELQKRGFKLVVVHGGGKTITDWLGKLGAGTRFVKGQRVTDLNTLEVVVAVLAGLVNKEIVAALNNLGGKAVGISGVDGSLIVASILKKELGFTGKVEEVNWNLLKGLLKEGYICIIAPPSIYYPLREKEPGYLNVNADAVAGALAASLKADRLLFLTDVTGIYDENKRVIAELNEAKARKMMESGIISEGMIPKIEACLLGSACVKRCRIIDGRISHALLKEIEGDFPGTSITK